MVFLSPFIVVAVFDNILAPAFGTSTHNDIDYHSKPPWSMERPDFTPSLSVNLNHYLKNISQIEHSRHRSVVNFLVNLFAGLIAYNWRDEKPSLHLSNKDLALLSA